MVLFCTLLDIILFYPLLSCLEEWFFQRYPGYSRTGIINWPGMICPPAGSIILTEICIGIHDDQNTRDRVGTHTGPG